MKKIFLTTIAAAALALTSCSNYLDVNQDPNSPSESDMSSRLLMPGVEMRIAASYGDFFRIVGGYFSQHYAQDYGTSNYVDYSAFYISPVRSQSDYTQLMLALANNNTVMKLAKSDDEPGTYLAATTLKAFAFEALVDCYGEVPYTQAFQDDNYSPAYDEGKTIYTGILKELDAAISSYETAEEQKTEGTNIKVCTNFLFGASSDENDPAPKWLKFANSLKLRILTRCIDKCPELQSELDQLVADNNFITDIDSDEDGTDVQYKDCWANESGSFSPFYAEEFSSSWGSTQINVIPNIAIIGTMQMVKESKYMGLDGIKKTLATNYADPRLPLFWTQGTNGYYGYISSNTQILSGTLDTNGSKIGQASFSRPQSSYNMPVVYISASDVDFYLAEYYAKKGDHTTAQKAYEKGIADNIVSAKAINSSNTALSSFDATAAKTTILGQFPYDQTNWKKCIALQKWICNAGINGFESWCEMRRLNYPTFSNPDVSGESFEKTSGATTTFDPSSYVAGTIYTPKAVRSEIGANNYNQRWPYPASSTSSNTNAPALKSLTTPVFWAAK